jgi:hypothetical protein
LKFSKGVPTTWNRVLRVSPTSATARTIMFRRRAPGARQRGRCSPTFPRLGPVKMKHAARVLGVLVVVALVTSSTTSSNDPTP